MASSAYPYGMVPVENLAAGYNTQGFETLTIADGYATKIYFGDVVKLISDGTVAKDTGTTSLTPVGVFVGCRYINSIGYAVDSQYWPAITTGYTVYAKIVTNPFAVFQIQANGSVASTDLGSNAAIVQTAGTTTFGKSKNALNASTIATTNTLPLRIVGLAELPNNAWGDAYTDVLVKWNAGNQYLDTTGV